MKTPGICKKSHYEIIIVALFLLFLPVVQAAPNDYQLIWDYKTGYKIEDLAVSSDGSSVAAISNNNFYLFEDGELLWKNNLISNPDKIEISSDGVYIVVLSSRDNEVYCLNRSGELIWSRSSSSRIYDIAVSSKGYVFTTGDQSSFLCSNCKVLCFDNNGKCVWEYKIDDISGGNISVSSDGSVIATLSYYLIEDAPVYNIYILNEFGDFESKFKADHYVIDTEISPDGSSLAVLGERYDHHYLYVLDSNEDVLWTYRTEATLCNMEISSGGCVLANTVDDIYFFDPEGKLLWKHSIKDIGDISFSSDASSIAVAGDEIQFLSRSDYIENFITEVDGEIENERSKGFDMESSDSLLLQAEEALNGGNYKKAFELLINAKNIDSSKIDNPIENAKLFVEAGRSEGLNVSASASLISQAEEMLNSGEYEKAFEAASQAETIVFNIRETSRLIDEARTMVESGSSKGFNVSALDSLLLEAEEALNIGKYERASEISIQVKDYILKLVEIETDVERVRNEVKEKKIKGFNVEEAESLVLEAEVALDRGNYERASEIVGQVKIFAPDRDRDGIPDASDYFPSINNFYVYMGAGIVLVGAMFTLGVGSRKLWKFESKVCDFNEKKDEKNRLKKTLTYSLPLSELEEKLDPNIFPKKLEFDYEPLGFLGEGGFASVFKVKSKKDGKILALKIPQQNEEVRYNFIKEVTAWYTLSHENIVKIYKADYLPIPHIEMEYVNGVEKDGKVITELEDYPKPLQEKEALDFIKGISNALEYTHKKGIYHHDLKPLNILLKSVIHHEKTSEGSGIVPKITDFGLAKIGERSSITTLHAFSPFYAAPEQIDREEYGIPDQRTDIYQLGVIFYNLLSGNLPYKGSSAAILLGKIISPEIKPEKVSKSNPELKKYDRIFEKLLAKRKENRYQTVNEFLSDLEPFINICK